eukprot:m.30272 g.30272  ORF g.30272 m.30272 type:complete len:404 (-) comp4762_c0_seq2:1342-2553(-)
MAAATPRAGSAARRIRCPMECVPSVPDFSSSRGSTHTASPASSARSSRGRAAGGRRRASPGAPMTSSTPWTPPHTRTRRWASGLPASTVTAGQAKRTDQSFLYVCTSITFFTRCSRKFLWRKMRSCPANTALQHPKALRVRDGRQQQLLQLVLRGVLRQHQRVEARVRRRQPVTVAALLDDDELELGQATSGHALGAGAEGQQVALLFVAHARNNLPEPLDDWMGVRVSVVHRVRPQLQQIQVLRAHEQQLQLVWPHELLDHLRPANDKLEALLESRELPRDGVLEEVLGIQPHVLLLVRLRDRRVTPVFAQVDRLGDTKLVELDAKRQAKGLRQILLVILEQLVQPPCQPRVDLGQVVEVERLVVHQLLVDDLGKVDIEDDVVVEGNANDHAQQLELDRILD